MGWNVKKRKVTFMLFIQLRLRQIHGLRQMNGYCAAFTNGIHGSGRRQIFRTSTGTAVELLSSSSSSPDDNTHRIVKNNILNDDLLRSILQKHGVRPNELNERCLLALSGCPSEVADYSVNAFAQQRRKREMKNEANISDPSAYIMVVLR